MIAKVMCENTTKSYDKVVSTVCRECNCGCGILAYVKNNMIVDIQGNRSHPVNNGCLCAKGIGFGKALVHPKRLRFAGVRSQLDYPFRRLENLEEAFDILGKCLLQAREKYGPDSLHIEYGPNSGLDFALGAFQFANLWGTPHVFCPNSQPAVSLEKICRLPGVNLWAKKRENVSSILIVELDLAEFQPVVYRNILEFQSAGAEIIGIDSRFTTTLSKADRALIVRPETGNIVAMAILKIMLEEETFDQATISAGFDGGAEWQESLATVSLDDIASVVGVPVSKLVELARLLSTKQSVLVLTGEAAILTKFYQVWPILSFVSGWDKSGGGWQPYLLQTMEPAILGSLVDSNGQQSKVRKYSCNEGTILISGGDCIKYSTSGLHFAEKMKCVSFFGAFESEALSKSHIVFPAALWPEREEICFSPNGYVQWGERITSPQGSSITGFDFWYKLAEKVGLSKKFAGKEKPGKKLLIPFYEKAFENCSIIKKLDIDALASTKIPQVMPFCDPEPKKEKVGIEFTPGEMLNFYKRERDKYPLSFQTISSPFLTGISYWSPQLRELIDLKAIQINPSLASRLGVANDDTVYVVGSTGSIHGNARITRKVPDGLVCSLQRFDSTNVLILKSGQTPEEALRILQEVS